MELGTYRNGKNLEARGEWAELWNYLDFSFKSECEYKLDRSSVSICTANIQYLLAWTVLEPTHLHTQLQL